MRPPRPSVRDCLVQMRMSCLASFVRLPSDLTPILGVPNCRLATRTHDVLMIRVIRQKNGMIRSIHATYKQRLRRRSDQRVNDQLSLGGGKLRNMCFQCHFLPEVREFIRDTKPRTTTTRGGRRARHPKTPLPHRPPGTPTAVVLLGGAPAGTRPLFLLLIIELWRPPHYEAK